MGLNPNERVVFNCVITDLIVIGSIYCYLAQHYWRKNQQIIVETTLIRKFYFNERQRFVVNSQGKVKRIYAYLQEKWTQGKLRVKITEKPI